MTNRKLRQALLKKLQITPQALSLRVKGVKKERPMTTTDATYVIAHKCGIPLDRFLSSQDVDRVRSLMPVRQSSFHDVSRQRTRGPRRFAEDQRIIVIGKEFRGTDPILPNRTLVEAKEMAAIYPLLYVLENSIREAIHRVMTRKYAVSWWDTKAPHDLKETVNKRMADENINSWHQRRGAHPLWYVDLNQLPAIVRKNLADFVPNIVPSVEWFSQFVADLYPSRCVLAHMNPLDRDNTTAVKLAFKKWQKQIKGRSAFI